MVSGCLPGRDTDVAAPCTHQELQSGAQNRSTRPPAGSRAFSLPWSGEGDETERLQTSTLANHPCATATDGVRVHEARKPVAPSSSYVA